MHYINIDPTNIGKAGACSVCCCEPIGMRPGETRLVTLNYAGWVIPIMANGGPGLVPTPEFSITVDADSCSNPAIDGFAAPSVGGVLFNTEQVVALNTPLALDLTTDTFPAGNTFEYRPVPVSGPLHGSVTGGLNGDDWVYTPQNGFNGYDQFWIEITDAQGRTLIRPVNVKVGVPQGLAPFGYGANAVVGLQIDRSTVKINSLMQTISFAMMLPPSNSCDTIDGCLRYRATIKAYARDCERTFSNVSCLDVNCAKC